MEQFRVKVITKTPNPQQVVYAAMHQDYSEEFVFDDRESWPSESQCGEIIVKRLLAGDRGHFGPLEHVFIVFNCGYFPHSVMQQVRTHRVGISFDVQCLAGNTDVTFVQASGSLRKIKIAELYDLWANGEKVVRQRLQQGKNGEPPGKYRRDCKTRLKKMRLRVLNEATGFFEIGHLKDVIAKGIQPVYRLGLKDGKTLDCTTNHRIFTTQGWQTMGDAVGLVTTEDGQVINMTKPCMVMCNGLVAAGNELYRNQESLEQQINHGLSTEKIADQAQCSRTMVRDWVKKYGLSLNTQNTQFPPEQLPWNARPDAYICQCCGKRGGELNAHHLIPVYADELLAYEVDNLVTLCKPCHENIYQNNKEAEFAQTYQPIIEPQNWKDKPKSLGNKLQAHPVKVTQVKFLGFQMTYDLEVEGPWHNFVANGMVVHNSNRYTGKRIVDAAQGLREIEEVFYLRPVGDYTDRQGKRYEYTQQQRDRDLAWCNEAAKRYQQLIEEGASEEHARGIIPFDVRQHWVMSLNARSLMHLLDLRAKPDAQLECQKLCELIWPHFQQWIPEVAGWYEKMRLKKARLSP